MADLPELVTPRLKLRIPTPSDAPAMVRFVTDSREHLAPWEPLRDDAYFTTAHWEEELGRVVDGARSGTSLHFVLEPRGLQAPSIIGKVTLSGIVKGPFQATYLGYGLDHRAVGRGLMGEALRAAVSYCFEPLHLHRIMANYVPTNTRSGRLLRRLGFVVEGYARDYLRLNGSWRDHVLTALTNPHWQET